MEQSRVDATSISNERLRVTVAEVRAGEAREYCLDRIELRDGSRWVVVASGIPGQEFSTSLGGANAGECERRRLPGDGWELRLSARAEAWEAHEVMTLVPGQPILRREQTYRFTKDAEVAIHPGWRVRADGDTRYSYPLRAHDVPMAGLPPMRCDPAWALPFPCHVWHQPRWVALLGVDRTASGGTLDFLPPGPDGHATLRVYFPDTGPPRPEFVGVPAAPTTARVSAGTEITLVQFLGAKLLAPGEEPLLEAERLAAEVLLREPPQPADLERVADGIADFYPRCELWEPEAFGPGRGWFTNMWVRTQAGPAKKRGEMSGYFDLGWGEGIAVEFMQGAVRYWRRTGRTDLLRYVDEMTLSIERFKRAPGDDQPYYDRSDGKRFGDFLMDYPSTPGKRIWTHTLGHTGSQLAGLYLSAPDYPNRETRAEWLAAARSIGRFFAKHQRENGDLQDIFGEQNEELNGKPHRISARLVVCGLWTRLAEATGERDYLDRALRLARAVAPEVERYEFLNQMLDGLAAPQVEFTDGEAAYYVLEGLVPLYVATRDPQVLAFCRKAAAWGILWTYFHDVPQAHRGIARGGQACRMPDLPLLYPIGPAKAVEPLLALSRATGDPFLARTAQEMVTFIGHYQVEAPGKPWHGGMVHAIGQFCGKHWGPDLAGQVDTGMATGNSLAAVECWLRERPET